ncbi:cytochrome P450 [Usnea florida]
MEPLTTCTLITLIANTSLLFTTNTDQSFEHGRISCTSETWKHTISKSLTNSYLHFILISTRIYRIGSRFDKDIQYYARPPINDAYFPMASTKAALARKSMHSPSFSKEAIRRSEHLITDTIAHFLDILHNYVLGERPVDLTMGFSCLTADIALNYTFQRPLNALDEEGFQSPVLNGVAIFTQMTQWTFYLPTFARGVSWVIGCLPGWVTNHFVKPYALLMWLLEASLEQIVYLQNRSPSEKHIRTVFDVNLNPNLEKGQFKPTNDEMAADACVLLLAGTDTISSTMVVITWALLNNSQMMQRLKTELREVMPGRGDAVDWSTLERLLYLSAIIREGLRLSQGTPGRLPRIVPPSGVVLCGHQIPAGTSVSSSAYVYHNDPHIFTDPETFRPERWLDIAPTDQKELESKFVPFSKGSRACIGINLAYAELYLITAYLFRRFDVSNAGTTDADMEWKDLFVISFKGHLKATVRESVE